MEARHPPEPRTSGGEPGERFLFVVVGRRSRVVHPAVGDDETRASTTAFLRDALTVFPFPDHPRAGRPRLALHGRRFRAGISRPRREAPQRWVLALGDLLPAERALAGGSGARRQMHDLRLLPRDIAGRKSRPAAFTYGRPLCRTPTRGARVGWTGPGGRRAPSCASRSMHPATPDRGYHAAPRAGPRNRAGRLAAAFQDATGESVASGYVDEGQRGKGSAAAATATRALRPDEVKQAEAKRRPARLPEGRVAGCSFLRTGRCRWLARNHDRLPGTPPRPHLRAFGYLTTRKAAPFRRPGSSSGRPGCSRAPPALVRGYAGAPVRDAGEPAAPPAPHVSGSGCRRCR